MALNHVAADHVTKQHPAVRMAPEEGGPGEAKREEGSVFCFPSKTWGLSR